MQKEYMWDSKQEQLVRYIFETKGSRILKNSMNKVQDKRTWISPLV